MMLVGDVSDRTAILVDDLADTSNTITRAARLLKKEGATSVIALITHGILSGNAIDRINKSDLDKVVVTNSVPQDEHKQRCPKLEVLEVGPVFAEVCSSPLSPITDATPLIVCISYLARVGAMHKRDTHLGFADLCMYPGYTSRPSWREHQRVVSI